MNRLANKVCLITGGGGAIGRATAQAFKDEGAVVVISDINKRLLDASEQAVGCQAVLQDVTNEAQWADANDLHRTYSARTTGHALRHRDGRGISRVRREQIRQFNIASD